MQDFTYAVETAHDTEHAITTYTGRITFADGSQKALAFQVSELNAQSASVDSEKTARDYLGASMLNALRDLTDA